MNLADHVDDRLDHVNKNRELIAQTLDIQQPVWLKQVHSTKVVDASVGIHHAEADAIYTDQANTVCTVLTADCLPLLFCNQQATVVAAAHAGWRGLANGVIENTVDAIQQNNKDLMVWLGPAIGPDCFEVGQDVVDAFVSKDKNAKAAFSRVDSEHYLADIYQLARLRLQRSGIEDIYGGGLCSYNDARFFSFRQEAKTGRMASLIWRE